LQLIGEAPFRATRRTIDASREAVQGWNKPLISEIARPSAVDQMAEAIERFGRLSPVKRRSFSAINSSALVERHVTVGRILANEGVS